MFVNYKRAFTLIELLVVVLIIGILSAIALPQYEKAVMKARFVQVQTELNTLMKAIDIYMLENGSVYTENSGTLLGTNSVLAVDLAGTPGSGKITTSVGDWTAGCSTGGSDGYCWVNLSGNEKMPLGLNINWYFNSSNNTKVNYVGTWGSSSGAKALKSIVCTWLQTTDWTLPSDVKNTCNIS